MARSASSRPRSAAAWAYAGSAPWLEPQYTAIADSWPGGSLLIRERQPLLGLRVEVVWQRAALRDGDVAVQVSEVSRADDGARQAGVAEREAEHELHPRQAALFQQVLQAGRLPAALALPGGQANRPGPPVLVAGRSAAGRAAANERASARGDGLGDEVLVLSLQRRVRDLEDVEDVHGDVLGQVRKNARHSDEADLSFRLQLSQGLDGTAGGQRGRARRHVHLHQVETVGAEPAQALLDVRPHVFRAVVVRVRRRHVRRQLQRAAALGRQEELIPPVTDESADELLAPAVVGRGVDQVDPAVEDRVQQPARVLVCYLRPSGQAPQLHGPVAEDGHVRAGAP